MVKVVKQDAINPPVYQDGYANNDIIHHTIPADGFYDLSRSYVTFHCQPKAIPRNYQQPAGSIYNINGGFFVDANNTPSTNAVVLRDSVARCDYGSLDEVHHSNVWTSNMEAYTRSFDDIKSERFEQGHSYSTSNGDADPNGGPFTYIYRTGNVPSYYQNAALPIHLKDSGLGIGSCSFYPALALGETRLQLTLDKQYSKLNLNLPLAAPDTLTGRIQIDNYNNGTGGDVNYGTNVPITLTPTYARDDLIPFWVGGPIRVRGLNDTDIFSSVTKIASIQRNPATGKVTITTTDVVDVVADTESVTEASISQCNLNQFMIDDFLNDTGAGVNFGSAANEIVIENITVDQSGLANGTNINLSYVTKTPPVAPATNPTYAQLSTDMTITAVTQNAGDIQIRLSAPVAVPDGIKLESIVITNKDLVASTDVDIMRSEIVLHKIDLKDPRVAEFNKQVESQGGWTFRYLSPLVEAVNNPQSNSFYRMFDLEPLVANLHLMAPPNGQLVSRDDNIGPIRHRLNDVEVLNRDVHPMDDLDNALKIATFSNRLDKKRLKMLYPYYGANTAGTKFMASLPVPLSKGRQTYQIDLQTTAPGTLMAAKTFYLFKEQLRAINISKNGVLVGSV